MLTDLKYACRMLLKSPGFTVVAVLTLALGIGANTAIFSVVDTVLLRPLAFPHPDQLVAIWSTAVNQPGAQQTASFPDFYDYRTQTQSFSGMAAYSGATTVLNGAGEAQELQGVAVNGDFFEVLGVPPMLGRGFSAAEAKIGQPNVVVISYGLWERAFGSERKIIGQPVNLAGRKYALLGVMPPGWNFPVGAEKSDFIEPLEPQVAEQVPQRGSHFLGMVGRLKPGVTAQQATAELKPIAARLARQYPSTNRKSSVFVRPLLEDIAGKVRPALLILCSAVALVLLIACANVANLLLARAAGRRREIGIRAALGASRWQIVRQLLVESFLLALAGGLGGLLLASWLVDLLRAFGPQDVPRIDDVRVNFGVCAFTFGLAILSTLLFGLIPALQVSRHDVTEALRQGSTGSSGSLHGLRTRAILVISQVALSLLLLAGAGLLIKSFFNLRTTNPGFQPAHLFVLDQVIPQTRYSDPDAQRRFYQLLVPKLAALPGVEAIGGANPLPFSNSDSATSFRIASQPEYGPGSHSDSSNLAVLPGYFRAMRIPLRTGRVFDEHDNQNSRRVALVNETFVRRFLPHTNPIGERIMRDKENGADALEIVGVVGDAKQSSLGAAVIPEFYQPFSQQPHREVWLTLRTTAKRLTGLNAAIRRIVHEADADVFVGNLQPMEFLLARNLAQPRFNMLLLGIFAAVAMLLAAVGIYGVIAYSVAQRTREIGIRMALGAQRADMLRMILRQSLSVVLVGLVVGLAAAFAATRLLASLLYGVGANDLFTYASVVFLLGATAFFASYIPARRAMKVDPMEALRYE